MSAPSPKVAQTAVSLRSVSLVSLLSVGQLVLLFVLQLVLAKIFGASKDLDVYGAVLAIPLVVSAVLSGSLGSVIIPLSHELHQAQGGPVVQAVLSRLGWILLGGSTALGIVTFLAAGPLTRALYGDFTQPQLELGTEILSLLCWLIPMNTMTSFLFSVYHTEQRFLLPAVAGLMGPALTVAIVAFFPEAGVRGLAWAVLLGGIAGIALLLPGFPRASQSAGFPVKPTLVRFGVLLWPLILGAAFFRLDPIVDRHLAAGLSEGSISHLGYAGRLIAAITVLATSGLSVVAFPAMARHAASGKQEAFVSEIAHGWRFLCVVLVPIIGGLLCFSETLVAWLLERGEFTPDDTKAVARLMCLYVGVIFAGAVGEMSTRAFYALGRTWVPTLVGIFGFLIGSAAKFALVSRYQAEGLALLTSAYYCLNVLVLFLGLKICVKGPLFGGLGRTFLRTLFCAACAWTAGSPWLIEGKAWEIPLGIAVCVVSYFGLQWLLKDEFALRITQGARRFLAAGKPAGNDLPTS